MEPLSPITPVNFFHISLSCCYLQPKGDFPRLTRKNAKKYFLPSTSALCNEESFAEIAMAWSEEGLEFLFHVNKPFEGVHFPDVVRGDSVEVFIDTRDVKTSGYNTRFCHHFFFLPEAVEGRQAGEITHFRTDDAHALCEAADLKVKSIRKKEEYSLFGHIPSHCLFGFDPKQFDRMGFTYRINRPHWESQHLAVVSADYQLEQQPSLWSHMRMQK